MRRRRETSLSRRAKRVLDDNDAAPLLGSPVLAGVKVNRWGTMRSIEAKHVGPAVSGGFVVGVGDAVGGKAGARERERLGRLASVTPMFGIPSIG